MKKQILLVEYDLPTIESIKEILFSPVFEITVADEGETAKKILGNKSFDLMISAAMLPKFHGFNLSQFVASSFPETRIIIISGVYRGLDYKHQATTQYQADDFFEKPLDGPRFRDRVMELLDLEEKDLQVETGKATTQIPAVDTAKIPTIKKIQEEKNLTSEDLFGDIIQKVETRDDLRAAGTGKGGGSDSHLTDELDQIIKQKTSAKKDKDYKKLDDEISKKFEETLSGLGLSSKKKEQKKPEPEPIEEPKPEPVAIEEKKETTKDVASDEEEIGGYDILGLIARGGMAEIYKAKKKGIKGFEKIIAIKKILSGYGEDDRYIEMFVDEAKIAAELTHPNIVQIHDLGKKDDYYFIAMEYVQGKDLREILRKLKEIGKPFPEELAIQLIIKVLTALNFAHTAKDKDGKNLDIVHRDISPPNILVSYTGEVKLTDFGVSKAANKIHQTIAGALKGKLLYMSPEQARGESDIDFRSDIYAVGVILFELITGEKLFLDSSEMVVLKKVQEGKITKPTKINQNIDTGLEEIILKALTSDKTQRYQNAAAFIKDLESYIQKNYNRMPDQNHIAHFLCDLFSNEIKKENLKIDLKPLSQEIKKIAGAAARTPEGKMEEAPATKPEPIPEPPSQPEAVPSSTIELESQENGKIREEIDPVPIEIELDKIEAEAPEAEVPPKPAPRQQPPAVQKDILTFEKETKKKRTGLIAAIVVIVVIVAGAYFLFFNKSSTGTTNANKIGQSQIKTQPPADQKKPESTPAVTDQKTEESGETATDKTPEGESTAKPEAKKEEIPADKPVSKSTKEPKTPETRATAKTAQPKQQPPVKKTEPKRPPSQNKAEIKEKSEQKPKAQPVKAKTEKVEPKKDEQVKTEEKAAEDKKEDQTTPPVPETKPAKTEEKPQVQAVPKAPEVKEGQTFSYNSVDTQPIQISAPPPSIPKSALRGSGNTTILAMILIDHNGNVESVKLIRKASRKRTNTIIVETIKKWKYKPATKNNVKVKVWKSIQFTLKPNK